MTFARFAMVGAVGICVVACLEAHGRAQSPIPLERLTVPPALLPAACRLSPKPSASTGAGRVRAGMWGGLPVTTNPWLGADRRILALIRERIDGPVAGPDGPPLSARELAAFRLRLADDVDEAYAAIYSVEGESELVIVSALRFKSDVSRTEPVGQRRKAHVKRLTSGRTAVAVSGDRSACFSPVWTYIDRLFRG